jgi:ABC-type multidrug transport system fused ATPase/permease subunit
MEKVIEFLKDVNVNVLVSLITMLIVFLSWLVKSFIEKPIKEARDTYNSVLIEKVNILSEIKLRLEFILQYYEQEKSKEFKEQICNLLLKNGGNSYLLRKEYFSDILKISTSSETDKELLQKTIDVIVEDLDSQTLKIHRKMSFYLNFSGESPIERINGSATLFMVYFLYILFFIIGAVVPALYKEWGLLIILAIIPSALLIIYWVNKLLRKLLRNRVFKSNKKRNRFYDLFDVKDTINNGGNLDLAMKNTYNNN